MKRQTEFRWDIWKAATVAIAVVVTTALLTGVVVAKWDDWGATRTAAAPAEPAGPIQSAGPAPVPARTAGSGTVQRDKTVEVLEKAVIGGAIGAGVGAAGGAIAGGGKGAGKGAAIGGIVGATAGTLYGLHDK